MGTVETFEHTADVGLRIRGADLDDLFRTAAEGLFDYIVANRSDVAAKGFEGVKLEADSPLDLLGLWLNELIFRSETEHVIFTRFDVTVAADGRRLEAAIGGEPIDPSRHVLDHEVKAVTHHGETLVRDQDGWLAELILDI